ncbi:hypothetical protein E9549_05445 [Blastococcus sp. MG754426]|uniref:AAA family ATPase n=1 Tax=unclassified Blastococcus TaxID=2619396 RepID=UPI001EF15FCC|nr:MULTISPECIES: AAA family ATPase [unclassified Blastococcus]MCF6506851.1 hypothetical protein [Blastococcus sp. MG754426]MCF6511651.1 hypothetical protein [Blastococcus sp. MG754427]
MRLQEFRVQNYKRIADTGWVSARDLTVLVGKNEAGKSAILRGLSKVNPSDGEKYDGLREFPRSRYSDEYDEDAPVGSVRFLLDDDEREALAEQSPLLAEVRSVEVTRKYDNTYLVGFTPHPGQSAVEAHRFRTVAVGALDAFSESFAPDGKGEEFGPLKESLTEDLSTRIQSLPTTGWATTDGIEGLLKVVTSKITEQWHQTALAPLTGALRPLLAEARSRAGLPTARSWVVNNMPQFIYFDRYDVLDSAIHIPTFISQLSSAPNQPRVRTTRCLFQHVNLDPKQLHDLIPTAPQPHNPPAHEELQRRADERAILTSSAGEAMTRRFSEWWLQRRHRFQYRLDGEFFRVWVSDDLDPSPIELDQRSQGMQYFFSFFLVFLVEAEGQHANSILLLDEPGNSLHGTAQAKIIEFLRKISADNQVIYSTHSPFMIDGDHLEEIRPVWEDPTTGTTKVSEDVWPKDKDALFPLQAALGYTIAQSLFISRRQVLVEGMTDYWILKALDTALAMTGRTALDPDVVLTPAGGASKMVPLASMLVGHQVRVAALLDGDDSGRREGGKVERALGFENRTIFVADHTHDQNPTGEIEDLFPDDYYLAAIKDAYGSGDYRFNADEKAIPNIVDRATAMYARKGKGDFEKWKVARALSDRIMAEPKKVPAETLDAAAAIAVALNTITTTE